MNIREYDDFLKETLADDKFSRKEKDWLKDLLEDAQLDESKVALYRSKAFAAAREKIRDPEADKILSWLEGVVKVLHGRSADAGGKAYVESCFTPGDDCPGRIASMISQAKTSIDICVFTITDNRIAGPILDAHERGIAVRILTDDDKANDPGSDIHRFAQAGVSVRIDRTPAHMHHKFAIYDDARLLTGSYNWTRGAAEHNQENFIVTDDVRLVQQFRKAFDDMWPNMQELRP